jgi:hypothetical protein
MDRFWMATMDFLRCSGMTFKGLGMAERVRLDLTVRQIEAACRPHLSHRQIALGSSAPNASPILRTMTTNHAQAQAMIIGTAIELGIVRQTEAGYEMVDQ